MYGPGAGAGEVYRGAGGGEGISPEQMAKIAEIKEAVSPIESGWSDVRRKMNGYKERHMLQHVVFEKYACYMEANSL